LRKLARIASVVAALMATGCFSAAPNASPETAAGADDRLGTFEVTSSGLARGEIAPTRCDGGDLEQFLGVDLTDESRGLVVRLVVDPLEGPALRVFARDSPWERTVLFFRETCDRFEMSLAPTGWTINDVVVRELVLDVDCANEIGATIRGSARARCG
jgi:hypothetical protein